jgi:hypothetical protein
MWGCGDNGRDWRAKTSVAGMGHRRCQLVALDVCLLMTVANRSTPHPLQRQWRCRELLRLRSSSDRFRYGAAIRAGRIDPNPHQIEAVRFALERLPEGGAIMADEVGLGKTIEAGLVCAQRLAEGARRILLLAPRPLLGQWRQELESLFGIVAHEGLERAHATGVVMMGREAATSEKGLAILRETDFDLVIVDEAHELFSGLHQRYDKQGNYLEDRKDAQRAGSLFELLRHTEIPVLLLTATPVQNRLVELWSLVQYVDRTSTLLGPLPTFKALFVAGDERGTLQDHQQAELRRRLREVVQRTLRKEAQEFLPQPFVDRHAQTFRFRMSEAERALYDEVTDYLLAPRLAAFGGNSRQLLLISFHRRMGSSRAALASSLETVAGRLERLLAGEAIGAASRDPELRSVMADLEEDELPQDDNVLDRDEIPLTPDEIEAELARVRGFAARARTLSVDAKRDELLKVIQLVVKERSGGAGSGKVVVFTESLATQAYLRNAVVTSGLAETEITLFNGTNDGPRAREALARWEAETQAEVPRAERPSRDVAIRLALVHEFRTRSNVLIASEAGAKGLNLQFCETVVNYDLPWNPQRIEQRIGRCHRYGQTRSVTVINFLAEDNAADQLVYEILATKLKLFEQVLGSSDTVLGSDALASALGSTLEQKLREIHERARSRDEIVYELERLRSEIDERRAAFEAAHRRTTGLIESTFEHEIQRVFRGHAEMVDGPLRGFDRDMVRVVEDYLGALGVSNELVEDVRGRALRVAGDHRLPPGYQEPFTLGVGPSAERHALHLGHPLLAAAAEAAESAARKARATALEVTLPANSQLEALRGRKARAALVWVRLDGFEKVDLYIPVVVLDGEDEALPEDQSRELLELQLREALPSAEPPVDALDFEDALEERLFKAGRPLDEENRSRHKRRLSRLERSIDDRVKVLAGQLKELAEQIERATTERDAALGFERRDQAQRRLERLEGEHSTVLEQLELLRARNDEGYQKIRDHDFTRRYLPPTPDRLFDVELSIR